MELKPVKGLKPFTKFLMTIGELPSSYLVSMTYEEQLLWFCNYLQNTVIPTVNNNAEAVIELQEFVSNYFDNLDVQEEINNKLDEMAESGELTEIIAEYLSLAALFCYDTIADMAAAENLDNGSSCYCLGKDTYNDGKGAFYKIREITILDVIDGYNIVAISNTEDLVGERLPNYEINTLDGRLDTLEDTTIPGIQGDIVDINTAIGTINDTTIPGIQGDVSDLETSVASIKAPRQYLNKKYLFIADSYATGYQGAGVPTIDGFCDKAIYDLGITGQVVCADGYGFLGMSNTHSWETLLSNTTIADKDTFTDVYILGGMNDRADEAPLATAMVSLFNYIKTNFPNAEIHVGHVGRYAKSTDANLLANRKTMSIYKYYTIKCGHKYINSAELLLHNMSWFISDGIHPNTNGQTQLAFGLEQYIVNGEITQFMSVSNLTDYQTDTLTTTDSNATLGFNIYSNMDKDTVNLYIDGKIDYDTAITINNLTDLKIGDLTNSYVCGSPYNQGIDEYITGFCYCTTTYQGSNVIKVGFRLYNNSNNELRMKAFTVSDDGNFKSLSVTQIMFPYGSIHCSASSRYC